MKGITDWKKNNKFFILIRYPFFNLLFMRPILLLCYLAFLPSLLFSQSFFMAGANFSTLSDVNDFPFGNQEWENFKLSPSIGYGYNININEKWSYQPSVTLGDLGGINMPGVTTLYVYSASMNQFVDYRPNGWISLAISPTVHYAFYAGITGKREEITNWNRIGGDVNRVVLCFTPRISFYLKGRWGLDLFYRYDLTSVGRPLPPPPSTKLDLRGSGVGINLKYQLQARNP